MFRTNNFAKCTNICSNAILHGGTQKIFKNDSLIHNASAIKNQSYFQNPLINENRIKNSIQSRSFHSSPRQNFFWSSKSEEKAPDATQTTEATTTTIQANVSDLGSNQSVTNASNQSISSADTATATGQQNQVDATVLDTSNAQTALKPGELDEILKRDELKSIYQDLDFNEETHSFFSYLDPTSYLASCCEILHGVGFSWWAAIAATGILIRIMASPLTVLNMRYTSKMSHHQERIKFFNQKKMEFRRKNERDKLRKIMNDEKKYRKEHGIELWKGFAYSGLQIPFFLAMFFSARHLLDLDLYPDMIEGGALWFKNLAEPSSFWGLPLITGFVQIANTELQQRFGQMRQSLEQQHELIQLAIRWGIRAFMLFAVWWMSGFESAYFCIWLPGALFQMVLTIIQITPQGRKIFKIPDPYLPPKSIINKKKTGIFKTLDKLTPSKLVSADTPKEKLKLVSQDQKRKMN